MALTDLKCKNTQPDVKPYKLSDGQGLFLHVMPKGGKYWRLKYRFLGKEKGMALGVYPEVTLAGAREKQNQARKLLAQGINPAAAKQEHKRAHAITMGTTFKLVARE